MTFLRLKIHLNTVFLLFGFFLPMVSFSQTILPILISTQNNGVLRDCECGDDCHGGLAERATLVARFRKAYGEILLLDGGDFSTTIGRQRKDEFVIQSYARLGYDAIAIGDQEFRNGWDFFQQITVPAKLPLVCANLYHRNSGERLTQQFFLKKIQGINIAITGCISATAFEWLDSTKYQQVEIFPFLPVLQKLVPELAAKADVIVLLAQVTPSELETIARLVDDISIIVAGHRPALPEAALQEKQGKMIVSAGVASAYLAKLNLHLNDAKELKYYDFDLICVGSNVPEDTKFKKFIDRYFEEFAILNHKFGPITRELPFYGPEYCRQCHVVAYKIWRTSRHANALNPRISCEICHVMEVDPAKESHADSSARKSCRRCHAQTAEAEFNFKQYWHKIKH